MCVRVKQFLFHIWTRVLYCLEFCFKIFTRPRCSKQRHQKPENDSPSKKIKIDTSEHCNSTVAIKKLSVANLKPCGRRSRYSDTMVDPNNRSADSSRLRNRGLSFDEEYVLSEQKRFQKKSFEYISQALEIDENSTDMTRKEEAILFYKKGIEELEKGINVFILGQGEKFDRAKDLRAKMQKNLLMAQDRLQILAKLVTEASEERTAGAGPTVNPSHRVATSTTGSKTVVSVGGRTTVPVGDRSSSAAGAKSSNLHKRTSSLPRSNPPAVKPNKSLQPTKFTNSVKPTSKDAPAASKDSTKRPSLNCLKNMDKNLVNLILDEIIDGGPAMTFNDVAGQETSKQALQEIVILPSLRPELFTGLRSPARGLLLFGPPGNGKTMLARAVASESNSTFFNISAASLTSKWLGEAEKLVRALFAAARELQPSIIFIDEIDSLLCERRENEHEASRRIKTQFLIEFQGVQSGEGDDRVLVMGATNRPYELDDAVLRRFPKRIYVPMPCIETRHVLLSKLLSKQGCSINESQIMHIASLTEGYSASDLTSLAKDAALGPIRELGPTQVKSVDVKKLRDINVSDFLESLRRIRPSVPTETFAKLDNWNRQYGDVST